VEQVKEKNVYPVGQVMKNKPDMVILNNGYTLLKVININGKKTVLNIANIPDEIQSGLLSQDILLPKGLVIPTALKCIIGDLDVDVTDDTGLRIENLKFTTAKRTTPVPELENMSFYIAPGVNRNIQVVGTNSKIAAYALEQDAVINDIKGWDGKFLLVTYFDSHVMNVISLMDEKIIKDVTFDEIPEQIVIDKENKLAYISSGTSSSIYVFDLQTMTKKRQLKINGKCDKLILADEGKKIFYVDRNKNDIWSIELDNKYKLTNLGTFPNISDIAYVNGKVYVISRTRARMAIVDYKTLELIKEIYTCEKPVRLYVHGDDLYILGASENIVEILDTKSDLLTDKLFLDTESFATNITPIENTQLVIVTNAKAGMYSVIDTETKDIVKTSPLEVPVRAIVVTDRVKTIK
jgi:DNA-binding beta-propeller fold protein YncE